MSGIEESIGTPLIFYSRTHASALLEAREFAYKLIGKKNEHPDLVEMEPEGKNYTKEQITTFLSDVTLFPYESAYKVTIFHHADKMLPVHANALLKTFEEKPRHAAIFLVTENVKGILGTIVSRSKKQYVEDQEQKDASGEEIRAILSFVSKGSLSEALGLALQVEEFPKDAVEEAFFSWCLEHKKDHLEVVYRWMEEAFLADERYTKPKQIMEYLTLKAYHFLVTGN